MTAPVSVDVRAPEAGDIGFAHTTGTMGALIRVGEWLRFRRGSEWNHAFIVSDHVDTDGTPFIIQATMSGVTDTARLDEAAPGGHYITMPPPPQCDRAKILGFAKRAVGTSYGLGTDVGIGFDIVTWDWVPSVRGARKPSWICSALVLEALRFAGLLVDLIDIYTPTPATAYIILTTSA